jgi:hypothetical protein
MQLRLTVALLVILGALMFAAGGDGDATRMQLALERAERQRLVQLALPDRPAMQPAVLREDAAGQDDEAAPDSAAPSVPRISEPLSPDTQAAAGQTEGEQTQDSPGAPPAPVAAPAPEPVPAPVVLYVTGNRVNLRAGPSTANDVVGAVTLGQAVELVADQGNGWVEIRVEGIEATVFMAQDFLSETP